MEALIDFGSFGIQSSFGVVDDGRLIGIRFPIEYIACIVIIIITLDERERNTNDLGQA